MSQLVAQGVPPLAVLGQVDGRRARAEHELGRQGARQLQRCLPAQRHDDALDLPAGRQLGVEHVGHVLVRQRLEVEAVGGVVVGRDGLGVAVDHHGLVAGVAQRHGGVHAAVVELDALPDAVGPRPEDDHAGAVGGADLVLLLVGGVVVRRERLELGGAGVDRLEGRPHTVREPGRPHVRRRRAAQVGQLGVGEAEPLGPAEVGRPSDGAAAMRCRSATMRVSCRTNQGSMPVRATTSSTPTPRRNAASSSKMRSGVATPMRSTSSASGSSSSAASAGSALSPARPCSSERSAFCSDSQNVRPMAMTSPTDCMRVPRRPSAPGASRRPSAGFW